MENKSEKELKNSLEDFIKQRKENRMEDQILETQEKKPISQKDAVFQYVMEELADVTKEEGASLKSLVTKQMRKAVKAKLIHGIKTKQVRIKKQFDDAQLSRYCSTLVADHLNKDKRYK